VKHILRRLWRTPAFSAIALITLALGIGANTAIFSVVHGVLLKPLPFPNSESLVGVWHTAPGIGEMGNQLNCSPTMNFTYNEESKTFENFGIWSDGTATVTGIAQPEQVRGLYLTRGVLLALGVQPTTGRWFAEADDKAGAADTAILSHGYWQRRFGGEASVLDRTIMIDSQPHRIIGVMPRDFRFMDVDPEIIFPYKLDRTKVFLGNFSHQGIARLKPGVTLEQANADVGRMLGIWINAWPTPPGMDRKVFVNARIGPKLQPLKKELIGDTGTVLWVLMGTIGLVLLIACANVANLLLVRAEGRQQELAIRAALGAGWGSIARDLLFESIALGAMGGALGILFAFGAVKALVALAPQTLPRLGEIGLDWQVLVFGVVVSLLTSLLFGLAPVLKYAGPQIAMALRGGGRSSSHSVERHRARNTLVVVQVALALVLLIGSGLMIRTFQAMRRVDPGFTNPESIQLIRTYIPDAQVKDPLQVMRMQQAMIDKLAALPGVTSVAFANGAPMDGTNSNDPVFAKDKNYAVGELPPIRRYKWISPGFVKTIGMKLIAGRDFTWTDHYEKRSVVMMSENMAREMWGSAQAAIGKQVCERAQSCVWREVVGVVGDVHDDAVHKKAETTLYWPALVDKLWEDDLRATRGGVFALRTNRAGTEGLMNEVRQAIWSVNNSLPVYRVQTMKALYDRSMARTSFTLVMLAIAGGMALILGVVGIYGVIAYAVSQRTREIGIRMALGAEYGGLRRMFVRDGLTLAGIGAAIGLGVAAALTSLMSSLLFGVKAMDPVTYAAVCLFLIGAAAMASYIPARRASNVDPVDALRAD
jgi:putative ABC transport system permease protein